MEGSESRTGYFIPVQYGMGGCPDRRVLVKSFSLASPRNGGRHVGQEAPFRFSYGFRVVMADIRECRLRFYTALQYTSCECSASTWRFVSRKKCCLDLNSQMAIFMFLGAQLPQAERSFQGGARAAKSLESPEMLCGDAASPPLARPSQCVGAKAIKLKSMNANMLGVCDQTGPTFSGNKHR